MHTGTIRTILASPIPPVSLAQALSDYWDRDEVRSLTAITDDNQSLTYGQLETLTAQFASNLVARGAQTGDVIGIAMRRSLDTVMAVLGSVRAGFCPCVLEPKLPGNEIEERLSLVSAKWLIFDHEHETLAASLNVPNVTPVDFTEVAIKSKIHTHPAPAPGNRALLLFTSGSTGKPKAVELSQSALLSNALGVIKHGGLSSLDRLLHVMPLYHTNGVNNQLFAPLLAGAAVIFAERFRAEDMPALLERYLPTIITGVPTMYSRMLAQSFTPASLNALRMARCGSAPITEALHRQVEEKLGCPLVVSYGLSEATCTSTMNPPDTRRIGSVGTVLQGQQVHLRAADGSMTNDSGAEGEICIGGPGLMSGYIGAPDATARAVSDGWLSTGDLGRFDSDGYLYVTGRIKDVIIRGGENILPLLIETVIVRETQVSACCVVGRADSDLGEVPVAVIVRGRNALVSADEVCAAVRRKLPRICVPQEVFFVEALPETAVGKVDRKALSALVGKSAPQATT